MSKIVIFESLIPVADSDPQTMKLRQTIDTSPT
jgi:hypothetical protein